MVATDFFVGKNYVSDYAKEIPVDVPAGVQSGDTLITWISANDKQNLTAPGGWTRLQYEDVGSSSRVWIYYRVATSQDVGGTWTWVFNGAHWHAVLMTAWTDISDVRTQDINSHWNTSSIDIPSLTAETDDILIGFGYHFGTTTGDDAPELSASIDHDIAGGTFLVGGYEQRASGATDTYTVTTSGGTSDHMAGASVLLIPTDEGGGEEEPQEVDVNAGVQDGYGYVRFIGIPDRPHRMLLDSNHPTMYWIDIHLAMSVDQTPSGDHALPGVIFREMDNGDYYMLRTWFRTNGTMWLDVVFYDASEDTLSAVGSGFDPNVDYEPFEKIHIKVTATGSHVYGRMWNDGKSEPSKAQLITNFSDTTIGGNVGLGFHAFSTMTTTNLEFRVHYFWVNNNKDNFVLPIVNYLLGYDTKKVLTPDRTVLSRDREWEPGEQKKIIINELLNMINYESLTFDEEGRAVLRPYILPDNRSSEYEYADNEISVMYPEMTRELDLFDIANKWVLTADDPDEKPIVVTVTNDDPANPTSTVRRGRTITDFREGEQATSRSTLMRKAQRIALEASREFEGVDFETAIMPMHSYNDTYTIKYGPLNINDKYTSHKWEYELEAGASMKHRGRRVVRLDLENDREFVDGDLVVTGAFDAGNIDYGQVTISPVADVPTSMTVSGYSLVGEGSVYVLVTANSTVPGDRVKEVSVINETSTSFLLNIYRTNTSDTIVDWLAYRDLH